MTRADFLSALARRTNKNTTLDTATQNRLVDFLNERHRRLLSMPGTASLRQATLTFASVADTSAYTLKNIHTIQRVYERTNDRALERMSLDVYRLSTPDPTSTTGTPTHFVIQGHNEAVDAQPTDASELYAVSTSGSDTQTVYVEGVITGNLPLSASATLTGATPVQIGTSAAWIRVDAFYVSSAAVGTISLREDGGSPPSPLLATITVGQTRNKHTRVLLWPTPSAAITYYVDVERAITNLAVSTDEPDLPEDFHDVLLLGALMDEYQHMNDARYDTARNEYQERLAQFKYWLATTSEGAPMPMEPPSRLGAWYPAGT